MSNSDGYVGAIAKASPSVINISIKKNIETRSFDRGQPNDLVGSGIIISDDIPEPTRLFSCPASNDLVSIFFFMLILITDGDAFAIAST